VKKRSAILSIFSAGLVGLFLIGSSGTTIVFHSCHSYVTSVHMNIFSADNRMDGNCCCEKPPCSPLDEVSESLENGCCTFKIEKLAFTDYNNTNDTKIIAEYSIISYAQLPAVTSNLEKSSFPIFIHNKHCGRDVLISNCQLII
jgi:hypothetical protein